MLNILTHSSRVNAHSWLVIKGSSLVTGILNLNLFELIIFIQAGGWEQTIKMSSGSKQPDLEKGKTTKIVSIHINNKYHSTFTLSMTWLVENFWFLIFLTF